MSKRLIDIVVSVLALISLLPVMLVTALLIRITLGKPILFIQKRPGLHGKIFDLCKFRTMHNVVDAHGQLLNDDHRTSRLGNVLRALSLDELPQLWNVLRGEMSLVGPRPLLTEYLELYTPEQAMRHAVRPGITGLAQVSGRNDLPWEERFKLDVWYVEHQSLALDAQIMAKTAIKLIRRDGINQAGHTIGGEKFAGSD